MSLTPTEQLEVILRRDWRLIAVITTIVTGLGVAYAFAAPSWYESELVVVPQSSSRMGGLAAALSSELPIDVSLGAGETANSERIQAVFKSRTVSDAVIEKFHLKERYHARYAETARRTLWSHCSTRLDRKPNLVTLTCEDKDPKIAQEMAAYFGEVGNSVVRNISATSAGEERRFLEKRWEQAKQDVETASTKLRDFEEKHKLIDLSEQSKAMVSAMASLKGELLAKQIQLSYLSGFSSADEATTQQLRREVSIIGSKLDSMFGEREAAEQASRARPPNAPRASKGAGNEGGAALFPSATEVPRLKFELEELFREKKIQETLFLLLAQRYEMARISEARDTSVFQILDRPVVAEHRSWPKRAATLVVAFVLGLLIGASSSLIRRYRAVGAVREPRAAAGM